MHYFDYSSVTKSEFLIFTPILQPHHTHTASFKVADSDNLMMARSLPLESSGRPGGITFKGNKLIAIY